VIFFINLNIAWIKYANTFRTINKNKKKIDKAFLENLSVVF